MRQLLSMVCYGSALQLRAQEMMGETEDGDNPLRAAAVTGEKQVPVETGWQGLQRDGDVTEPERPPCTVSPQMQTKEAEVILRTENPDFSVSRRNDLRPLVQIVQRTVVHAGESGPSPVADYSPVQIHPTHHLFQVTERHFSGCILLRWDAKVDVPVRPQTRLWIEPGDSPTLGEEWLDSDRAKMRDDTGYASLIEGCLEAVGTVEFPELIGRPNSNQRRRPDSPPAQSRCPSVKKQCRYRG
jgi:hypothetical protein